MRVKDEIGTFTKDALKKAEDMETVAHDLEIGSLSEQDAAAKLDRMARDLATQAGCIKDLAYRLKMGQERVTSMGVR